MDGSEVLLIGGRSGVGKTTVGHALHSLLRERDVRHALIEGDNLDLAHPPTWDQGLAELNLASMWANYRRLGYRRLIYTNTVSVLESETLANAMGDAPRVLSVLLRASDSTAAERLSFRERGRDLDRHVQLSAARATALDEHADETVTRVQTDDRTAEQIAESLLILTGWG